MRTIPPGLASRLDRTATTLCHCWRVTRRDGTVLGFTEHDRPLTAAGTRFEAAAGFRATLAEGDGSLSPATSEVTGGFSSAAITEADLAAGRYDGALVEVFLVDWEAPGEALLLRVEEIGDVVREGIAFRAELRSFTHRLGQPTGRVYQRRCTASLGDAACGVDLAAPGRRVTATVTACRGLMALTLAGRFAQADGAFREGALRFDSGALAGLAFDIETDRADGAGRAVELFLPLPQAVAEGDRATLTVGCDKSFERCRTVFSNGLNFRGFPHLPGADFAYSYADGEREHDGRALFP